MHHATASAPRAVSLASSYPPLTATTSRLCTRAAARYGKSTDMFSVGVILYESLSGFPPFYPAHKCTTDTPTFIGDQWSEKGGQYTLAKDLLLHLLDTNPKTRFTAEQAIQHAWFDSVLHAF